MKPWMAIIIVIAALAGGIWLMAPRDPGTPGAGGGGGTGGGMAASADDSKIATISSGQRVEIAQHLAEGRYTVVEFTADW